MRLAANARRTIQWRGPRQIRGGTLLGVVIGFALGVSVAGVIAFVLTKTANPFDGKSPKLDVINPNLSSVEREAAKQADRPRFDFSKILPGTEERKTREATVSQGTEKPAPAVEPTTQPADKGGKFYLQAGAYQNAADAEDQRAKLALMGIEASMQTIAVPDKGTLNRVRLGPYGTADEMNQVKTELLKRGVATAVIRSP